MLRLLLDKSLRSVNQFCAAGATTKTASTLRVFAVAPDMKRLRRNNAERNRRQHAFHFHLHFNSHSIIGMNSFSLFSMLSITFPAPSEDLDDQPVLSPDRCGLRQDQAVLKACIPAVASVCGDWRNPRYAPRPCFLRCIPQSVHPNAECRQCLPDEQRS